MVTGTAVMEACAMLMLSIVSDSRCRTLYPADTDVAPVTATVQPPVPLHAPPQPVNS